MVVGFGSTLSVFSLVSSVFGGVTGVSLVSSVFGAGVFGVVVASPSKNLLPSVFYTSASTHSSTQGLWHF